jgi:flagellar biosynthesis protein FlhA
MRHQAEMTGATVVDRASVLITHLGEVVRAHASRLLSREDVKALVESVRRVHPVVVEDLVPSQLSLGEVQRVLRGLLDERVPVRDLVRIFEALSLGRAPPPTSTAWSRPPGRGWAPRSRTRSPATACSAWSPSTR